MGAGLALAGAGLLALAGWTWLALSGSVCLAGWLGLAVAGSGASRERREPARCWRTPPTPPPTGSALTLVDARLSRLASGHPVANQEVNPWVGGRSGRGKGGTGGSRGREERRGRERGRERREGPS